MDISSKDWSSIANRCIMPTYGRSPVTLVRGKGCRVFDTQGQAYLDFVAGIAVCNLGHAHPEIADAVCRQAQELVHVSNLYYTIPQIELAELLTKNSFADQVFFCNSGAEANEAAIKLARKYSQDHFGKDRYEIICLKGSFHGRTLATLSATGQEKFHKGFEPLVAGFKHVRGGDLRAIEGAITRQTCAILMEPIQGEGGVVLFPIDYLQHMRKLCDEHQLLFILDEVQVGMGRTGTLFAYEHFGIKPDLMTLAKALANGLPIGALLAKEGIARSFTPGTHASTFGGNPITCKAATVVLKTLIEKGLLKHCQEMGRHFREGLKDLAAKYPTLIKEARGLGLMLGLELKVEGSEFVTGLLNRGFLVNCVQGNILRFTPPLIINKDEIDMLLGALDEECRERL